MKPKSQKRTRSKEGRSKYGYLRRHPFFMPVVFFLILFFLGMVTIIGLGGETLGPSDSKVVRLFVDNTEQVVPTRAQTVADLLTKLNITVGDSDIVEPGPDTAITDSGFEVNVYRARAVLVEDRGPNITRKVIYTAKPAPEQVAREVGFTVFPEDIIEKVPAEIIEPTEAFYQGVVAEKIVINRAVPVSLNLYGTSVMIRTHSKTVGELLSEKGINVNEGDTLQPSAQTALTSLTQIFITRFGTKIEQVEEEVDPPTQTVDDYDLTLGSSRVREQGKPGKRIVTYEIIMENDVEVSRKVLQELVVEEPVPKVIAKGRKAPVVADNKAEIMAAAGISSNEYYAADYIISHESGWRVNALSSNGCAGLGQACPASKLARVCPNWESDAVCQMKFFNNYAVSRYGSWTRAFEVWQLQRWW